MNRLILDLEDHLYFTASIGQHAAEGALRVPAIGLGARFHERDPEQPFMTAG